MNPEFFYSLAKVLQHYPSSEQGHFFTSHGQEKTAMTYLQTVSNTLAGDDQSLITRAKAKVFPSSPNQESRCYNIWPTSPPRRALTTTPYRLYHFHHLLPASLYNHVLPFRPLPPNRCFDCVRVVDGNGRICWDLFSEGMLEANGVILALYWRDVTCGWRMCS